MVRADPNRRVRRGFRSMGRTEHRPGVGPDGVRFMGRRVVRAVNSSREGLPQAVGGTGVNHPGNYRLILVRCPRMPDIFASPLSPRN